MKDDNLFRSVALERLSSPENLDQVMRVVPAKSWIALASLFVFLAAACVWAFCGEITRQSEFRGVFFAESAVDGEIFTALETGAEGELQAGMRAEILLDSGETVTGTLVSAESAASQAEDSDALALAESMLPDLAVDRQTQIIRVWLDEPGSLSAQEPALCTVRVILERFHPIRLILPE